MHLPIISSNMNPSQQPPLFLKIKNMNILYTYSTSCIIHINSKLLTYSIKSYPSHFLDDKFLTQFTNNTVCKLQIYISFFIFNINCHTIENIV